ncbi:hypothetical protein FACS189460_3090 [Deltaproteobacteria bacterium]|nr:hypothetical protein FACS189460_3090 [Deltaproteobacteria bacterium]
MFRMPMMDGQGREETLYYDPAANRLFNADREPFEVRDETPADPAGQVFHLRLALGKDCNFNCQYCHQGPARRRDFSQPQETLSSDQLTGEILRWAGPRALRGVGFWGGEPLLYFDQIRELHRRLNPHNAPGQPGTFYIVTNGSLLGRGDIADWIINNQINLTLSWDGPGQRLRGSDPLADPAVLANFRRIHAANPGLTQLAPVWTRANNSPARYLDLAEEVLGFPPTLGDAAPVVVMDADGLKAAIPPEGLPELTRGLAEAWSAGRLKGWNIGQDYIFRFFSRLNVSGIEAACHALSEKTLTVNLAGDILACQNVDKNGYDPVTGERYRLGRLQDLPAGAAVPLPWCVNLRARFETRCNQCLVKGLCGGGCPYSSPEYFDYNCRASFHYRLALLVMALHALTGRILRWDSFVPPETTEEKKDVA